MTESPRSSTIGHVLRYTVAAALGVAVFFMVASTSVDVDLWGHVRFGLDILERKVLDGSDPYSFTSDRSWINHEWLSEVTFAAAWEAAGATGLIGIKLIAVFGALFFVRQTLKQRGVSSEVRLILLGLTLAGMLPRLVHVRPQLFSVLFFSILMWVFARAESGRRGTLAICPPLMALWTNFHGGWITGLGALGVWALTDLFVRRREGARALDSAAWTSASILATLINPYGPGLWTFLLATVRFGREGIGEWGPIWMEPSALVVWVLFALMTVAAIVSTGVSRLGSRFVQPVLWGLASVKVARLDAFFALSVTGFLGPAIEKFLGRRPVQRTTLPVLARAAIVAALLAVALAVPAARRTLTCIPLHARWWPEPAAIEFIRSNGLSGRMITFFNWGEYAIWHLPPSIKISMDGRRETVYTDGVFRGHLQFYDGGEDGIAYVERLHPDYAWLPVKMPGALALRDRGWDAIFEGEQSIILAARHVTDERPSLSRPAPGPSQTARCFPSP